MKQPGQMNWYSQATPTAHIFGLVTKQKAEKKLENIERNSRETVRENQRTIENRNLTVLCKNSSPLFCLGSKFKHVQLIVIKQENKN